MTNLPVVRRARYAELGTIAALVGESGYALPIAAWLVPNELGRGAVLTDAARIWVEHALFFGEIDVISDEDGLAAAAVWFHRYRPVPPPTAYEARLTAACGENAERITALSALLDNQRPEKGHQHLAFLAVTADLHGTGMATALLAHHHTQLDRYGTPAYTEAYSTGHEKLLTRHGYQPRPALHLPDRNIVHPMWRASRTAT
ncbi:N-acetyltransferase [Micromonospora sp. NPDC003197]